MTEQDLLARPAPAPARPRSITGNTIALAAARIAPMLTGFVFWAIAALALPPARLGVGSALVSAVLLVVQLGLLGIGPATVTLLPSRGGPGHGLVTASLVVVTCGVLLVGTGTILITRAAGGPVGRAWDDPAVIATFLTAGLLATIAYQLDHIAVARACSQQALTRSILQGLVQLGSLAAALAAGSRSMLTVLAAVAAGAGASVALGAYQLARTGWRAGRIAPGDARLLVRHGLPNYALLLADRAPGYLLPLIVTTVVSPAAAASWYLVWMLASAVFFVPQSAGYSLQAHLAATAGTRRLLTRTLGLSTALTAAAAAGLVLLGPPVLARLGHGYASGRTLLPIMASGLLVAAVTQLYYGVCRARARLAEATAVAVTGGLIAVVPAAVIASGHGLAGLSLLWLTGQVVAALLAGARLVRLTRTGHLPAAPAPRDRPDTPLTGRLLRRWPTAALRLRRGPAGRVRHPLGVTALLTAGAAALAGGIWSLARTRPDLTGPAGPAPGLHPTFLAALTVAALGVPLVGRWRATATRLRRALVARLRRPAGMATWLSAAVAVLLPGARLVELTRAGQLPAPHAPRSRTDAPSPRRLSGRWVFGARLRRSLTGRLRRPAGVSTLLCVAAGAALAGGVWSLTRTRPDVIGSLGLAPDLHPTYLVALAVAVLGPVLSLRRSRQAGWVLTWQLVVLIVLLHGIDPVIHGTPRLEASYRHLGIASHIASSGELDPTLDAYFSWPGFFSLLAMISGATGAGSLMGVATWAPLGADLLLLPVLATLAHRLAPGWRTAWAGVWLFYLTDWVGQDYLSPQAFALQLGLTVLAVVLVAFPARAGTGGEPGRRRRLLWLVDPAHRPGVDLPAGVRAGLIVGCAGMLAAITAAHQLTPYALALTLLLLAATRRTRLRLLPVLAVLLPVAWLVLVATPYLSGHAGQLFGSVGDVGATANASVTARVAGDPGHRVVVDARLAQTALVWCAAAAGAYRLRRRRLPWLAAAVGAGAPMLMLPAQPYGGELMLRAYLYGLPFAAVLAAAVLAPTGAHRWRRTAAVAGIGLLLAGTTLLTRYGNDAMETFTPAELALATRAQAAPPGSLLIEAVHDTPWRFEHYATFTYRTLLPAHAQATTPTLTCAHVEQLAAPHGAYLLVTDSQQRAARLLGVGPPGAIAEFLTSCGPRHRWTSIAATSGGVLIHIAPAPPRPQALPGHTARDEHHVTAKEDRS